MVSPTTWRSRARGKESEAIIEAKRSVGLLMRAIKKWPVTRAHPGVPEYVAGVLEMLHSHLEIGCALSAPGHVQEHCPLLQVLFLHSIPRPLLLRARPTFFVAYTPM